MPRPGHIVAPIDSYCARFRRSPRVGPPQLRDKPGYVVALLQLASPAEADPHVRLMSAIVLKNAAFHTWEHNPERNFNISEEDKEQVRRHVMAVRPSPHAATGATWLTSRPSTWTSVLPAGLSRPERRPALGAGQPRGQHCAVRLPGASAAQGQSPPHIGR